MIAVSEALILTAGQGSRLRGSNNSLLKPFVPVCGRPLISYTLEALLRRGIKTVTFVVGYERDRMIAQLKQLIPSGVTTSFIENRNWRKQNGISVLAAAGHIGAPLLLAMGDHVFDDTIIDCLLDNFESGLLNIAIDRKLHSIVDLEDAMKVQTCGNKVIGIGKNLRNYDAIDTGLFVCPAEIFAYLERAKSINGRSDCSFADAIELMAVDGKVRGVDIGGARWHDIDTPRILQHAEQDTSWRVTRSLK